MQIEQYKPDNLNLSEFIEHYNIDMILNNDLISKSYFELYNDEEFLNMEIENNEYYIREELLNYPGIITSSGTGKTWTKYALLDDIYTDYYTGEYTLLELLTMEDPDEAIEELEEAISDYSQEHYLNDEIYQYFIISESDLYSIEKYTNYPIYYSDELDIYLLGITHWGMSWSFFFTEAPRPQYMRIKKYDEILSGTTSTA